MVKSYQEKLKEPERVPYPTVNEFMAKSFVRAKPDTNIYEVMNTLVQEGRAGAVIVDDEDNLIGIVSEKDCLRLVTQDSYENIPHGGPVSDFMSTNVLTVTPETGLNEVAQIFMEKTFKKIPVIDHGKLVGVVRRHDVLRTLREFYRARQRYLRKT